MGKRVLYTAKEKLEILEAKGRGELTVGQLARAVGVSSHAIYEWKKLYETDGYKGLEGHTALPESCYNRKPIAIEQKIVKYKLANMKQGAKQISGNLERFHFLKVATETVRRILKRKGLLSRILCIQVMIASLCNLPSRVEFRFFHLVES